jgi:proteasome lid subunit RPN8/RPN11
MKKIKGIAKDTLEFILEVSKSSHPKEFAGLLTAEKGIISNVMFLPGTQSSYRSAMIRLDMLPLGVSIAGTAHSHPTPNKKPSEEDLAMFSNKGEVHIIACHPYDKKSWVCYDSHGTQIQLPVLDVEFDDEIDEP